MARADFIITIHKDDIDFATGVLGQVDVERMRDVIRAVGDVIDADAEPR